MYPKLRFVIINLVVVFFLAINHNFILRVFFPLIKSKNLSIQVRIQVIIWTPFYPTQNMHVKLMSMKIQLEQRAS